VTGGAGERGSALPAPLPLTPALFFAWLALAAVTSAPYVAAARNPPPRAVFTGALFYRDDFFQYLSFAEQAGRGAFLLANKFDPDPHPPVLVNLEWWAAGRLGALLGGRPVLAFHALRVAAVLALLLAAAWLLALAGLAGPRLALGTALVATGGGLGWLRLAQGTPFWQVPDLLMGIYPAHQSLYNPHFVVGTALLLWTVLLHLLWRLGRAPRGAWLAVAWALGLCRPYDLVPLVATLAGLAAFDLARHRDLARAARPLLDLAWLTPLLAYYAIVAGGHPSFAGWGSQAVDLSPPRTEMLLALGPAAVLAALGRERALGPEAALVRRALAAWSVSLLALTLVFTHPMAKQCVTTAGAALLLWAATSLSTRALAPAVLLLAPTSALLLWMAFRPAPDSFASADEAAATARLATACRARELAVAPTDLSLMIAGLTPCTVALGHRLLTPRFAEEVALGNRFYDTSTEPAWRLGYLERKRAAFVVLPPGGGSWLGAAPPFERLLTRPGLEVWRRIGAGARAGADTGYARGAP
jgi:hypothetical protein